MSSLTTRISIIPFLTTLKSIGGSFRIRNARTYGSRPGTCAQELPHPGLGRLQIRQDSQKKHLLLAELTTTRVCDEHF